MFPSLNALNLRFEDAGNPFQYSLFASACTDFVPNFPKKIGKPNTRFADNLPNVY